MQFSDSDDDDDDEIKLPLGKYFGHKHINRIILSGLLFIDILYIFIQQAFWNWSIFKFTVK